MWNRWILTALAFVVVSSTSCRYTAREAEVPHRSSDQITLPPFPKQDSRAVRITTPSGFNQRKTQSSAGIACVTYVTELDDVEAIGDSILVGEPLQAFATGRSHFARYHREYFGDSFTEHPIEEWTVGAFRVTEVLNHSDGSEIMPGQIIWLSEPVGLLHGRNGSYIVSTIEDWTELKQHSRYVVFAQKDADGTYIAENFNLGRFNVDGTDPEDETGGAVDAFGAKTDKQKLREELTTRYGVQFNFLPDARIVSAANVWTVASAWKPATQITVSIGAPRPAGTELVVERQSGDGPWAEIKRKNLTETSPTATGSEEIVVNGFITPNDGTANVPKAGDSLRVRMVNANRTSNYSTAFEMVASPEP